MKNKYKNLENALIAIGEISEKNLEDLSNNIDEIIENNITDERTISLIYDSILSIEFIDDDKKRKVFYKLSNYCQSFNKKLADDYNEILEEDLNYDNEEYWYDDLEYEIVPWYEEGMKQFESNEKKYLKSNVKFKNYFLKIKKEVNTLPELNELSKEDLQCNRMFKDLTYLVIRFFNEVMTEEDFNDLKYRPERIKKYGNKALKDMFEYYSDKYKI